MDFKPHFDNIFDKLGYAAEYIKKGDIRGTPIKVLCASPESYYQSGETQAIGQIATLQIRKYEFEFVATGDYVKIGANVYQIYDEPLLNNTGDLWNCRGVLIER